MIGLSVYSATGLSQLNTQQVRDSVDYFEPDALYLPSNRFQYQFQAAVPTDLPVVTPRSHGQRLSRVLSENGVELVVAPARESLSELGAESTRTGGESGQTYVLSDLLSVELDLTALETRLDGREAYEEALRPDALDGAHTHLLTTANPGYRATWGELELQGVMPGANRTQGSSPAVAHLRLQSSGTVTATTRDASQFGVRALQQVGRRRAETLRDAGLDTPRAVADAAFHRIQELDGFGRPTAETVVASAEALVTGEVRHQGEASLPGAEPVFVDIETDGLNPTMVWLIGVLDREGEETYTPFLATDPDDPGAAVEAFVSWLVTNAKHRPVVAYNGYDFDFPVLEEHVQEHCPEYLDDWRNAWTFDPYYWAVTQGNAILPGRTNKLADVAAGLGWESSGTGLSGAAVARLFQQYMRDPSPRSELDWDRHVRYCEDDVRALARVFDALTEAPRRATDAAPDAGEDSIDADETAQGRLTDF